MSFLWDDEEDEMQKSQRKTKPKAIGPPSFFGLFISYFLMYLQAIWAHHFAPTNFCFIFTYYFVRSKGITTTTPRMGKIKFYLEKKNLCDLNLILKFFILIITMHHVRPLNWCHMTHLTQYVNYMYYIAYLF